MEQEGDSGEWTGRGYTLKRLEPDSKGAANRSETSPPQGGSGGGSVPAYPASMSGQQYAPPPGYSYHQPLQKPPSGKPRIAGVMLIIVAILGFAFAGSIFFIGNLMGDLTGQDDFFQGVEEKGIITGTVEYANGTPVSGVSVSVVGKSIQATTDGNGDFRLEDVDMGTRDILFEKAGHKSVRYTMFVSSGVQPIPLDIEMETGTGEIKMDDGIATGLTDILVICAVIIVVFSIFPLLGGIMAFRRKSFGLAVLGGILGIFSIGFFLGTILSIIALIVLLMSKDDFRGHLPPMQPYNPYPQYGQQPYQPPSYGMPPQQPYQPPREPFEPPEEPPYQPPQ